MKNVKLISLCLFSLLLVACRMQTTPEVSMGNAVALADAQRHKVIEETRLASYSVFPDTDDVAKLEDPTILDAMRGESPNGSAFGVRRDGLIATNMHVIEGTNFCTAPENTQPASKEDATRERERKNEETLRSEGKKETHCLIATQSSTKVFRAKLVRADRVNDIALLCIINPEKESPALHLEEPANVKTGSEVLTIGAPLGNTNMLTIGLINNPNYISENRATGKKEPMKVQFAAAVLPGNSGGPLVSVATGKIVGQVVAVIGNQKRMMFTQMSFANPVEFLRSNVAATGPCK